MYISHPETGEAAGSRLLLPLERLSLDPAPPRCNHAVWRLAGRIYRESRRGRRVIAELPGAEDAASLRLACDRIGIRPSPQLAISGTVRVPEPIARCRPLRIALAGYGVVGQALARRLAAEPDFEIAAILVRDTSRSRTMTPPCRLTADREAFFAAPAEILIDVLSCETTGGALCVEALAAGRHVVSASKRVISTHRAALADAACRGGARLLYSAAVGGAAPVLETVAAARARGKVREVCAVLNGTVNFVLDRLHKGYAFTEALAEAQRTGFAEEDSINDLSGADAAAKLKLIAAEAWGHEPQAVAVSTEPLDAGLAAKVRASRERWIQVAKVSPDGGEVAIRPASAAGALPTLPDEWNAAEVVLDDGSVSACAGRGAGGVATAEAIVADLFEIREAEAC